MTIMRAARTLAVLLFAAVAFGASAQTPAIATAQASTEKMNTFVTALMSKMTLDEKIGQLNLPGAGDITTGQAGSTNIAKKIEEGKVGGLFNIKSVAKRWINSPMKATKRPSPPKRPEN